jgi:tetratricopeptide (TPR) repeat protein
VQPIGALAATIALGTLVVGGTEAVADQNDGRLDALFARLAGATDRASGAVIEQEIWAVWMETSDDALAPVLARGIGAMNTGDFRAALAAFDALVRQAPEFAEGWNKRATLYYLMGALPESVRDIERTLALEPRHFGALSGLALIREAEARPFEALEALERVVQIHPQLPGLLLRVDRLTRQLGEPI